jgi:hypothetical protein
MDRGWDSLFHQAVARLHTRLFHEILALQRKRFDENPTLQVTLEQEAAEHMRGMHPMDRGGR